MIFLVLAAIVTGMFGLLAFVAWKIEANPSPRATVTRTQADMMKFTIDVLPPVIVGEATVQSTMNVHDSAPVVTVSPIRPRRDTPPLPN